MERGGIAFAPQFMAVVTLKRKPMKKSMIMMCIAAIVTMYVPVMANESKNIPPAQQGFRILKEAGITKQDEREIPKEVTPVTSEDGNENSGSSQSAHSGYIVISGVGLLLLIILLIILL